MDATHQGSERRAECRRRAERARKVARHAGIWARWHQVVYYAPIVIGIVAGAVGGVKGLKDNNAEFAGWAAAIAGAATAMSLKFNKDAELGLASLHWTRAAGFEQIAQRYDRLAIGQDDPRDADFDDLEKEWAKFNDPKSLVALTAT